MTKEKAIANLKDLPKSDPEIAHGTADMVLIEFLKSNGYEDVAEAWEKADTRCGFWYA